MINGQRGLNIRVNRSLTSSATAGSTGNTYPGSFDPENEKNTIGNNSHAREKTRTMLKLSPPRHELGRTFASATTRYGVHGKASIKMITG